MKRLLFIIFCFTLLSISVSAQTTDASMQKNKDFTGAPASKKTYNAIFQLDSNDPKIIHKTIRNINNALTDERLKGKLQIELISY